ncbi:MAG: fatty-acid--CoA ligase [Aeromicrobium sp.]|nr:fatty-acid--CoA ligase [Aeromicrobium sp.]
MYATVGAALAWWAKERPTTAAYIFEDEVLDYGAIESWSSRVALHLQSVGVRPGDRVGIFAANSAPWPIAALGVMKAGAVLVPLNSRFTPAELRTVLSDAGATAVIVDDSLKGVIDEANDIGDRADILTLSSIDALRVGDTEDFRIDRGPEEPIAIIFTSGSTGQSKGVILTSRTLMSTIFEATLTEEGFHRGATSILVVPLSFTPGLVWGLLMTTVIGGTLVIEKDLDPGRAVTLIERHQVEAIFGVPLIYQALAGSDEFATANLSSLKTAIVGGAAVPMPLLEAWASKGVALRQIYGMTEAGGTATATPVDEFREHPDTCGSGLMFTRVKTVRADGTDAAPGETGELVIAGPGVTPGYWNAPEITAQVFQDGWLHSGDLGTVDADGRIRFVDRLKDLIITGGINVSPVELEMAISCIDGVIECAVIAAQDEKFGETPAAIIHAESSLTEDAVLKECSKVLANFKVPRYVILRDEPLPRLPNGKISKKEIRAEYADLTQRYLKVH